LPTGEITPMPVTTTRCLSFTVLPLSLDTFSA
jgi:hypothetical protein